MVESLSNFHPVIQALLATIFTWFLTMLGASTVFMAKKINQKLLDTMMGFAGGVMIAASFWSLLAPAIEMASDGRLPPFLPASIGFVLGAVFLRVVDRVMPHLHLGFPDEDVEGVKVHLRRVILLVLAITLHNIPEGLAVGVAFGAVHYNLPSATLSGAISLAFGIGIQNFPEGLAVSMPLRREGFSRLKSFWYGQLSGVVEPVAGILGAASVLVARPVLPYALSFAAGAMIFVVVEELIPESQLKGNGDSATMGLIIGFTVMMLLDVAFG